MSNNITPSSEIWQRRIEIDKREREERMELLKDHSKKFSKERASLIRDCEEIGHIEGKFWDNGLGFTWFYCNQCGGQIKESIQKYNIRGFDDDE